jgi:hypothetical protein
MATRMEVGVVEVPIEGTRAGAASWPVYWSAVWVGALSAIAAALLLGLLAVALGAYVGAPGGRLRATDMGVGDFAAAVGGAFFAFVLAGWTASQVAGLRRADTAALHGALAWLVAVPLMVLLVALGAGSLFGAWYGGLAGTPAWVTTAAPVQPEAAREAATGTLTALLLGLVGAVLGGWLGSGESMDPRNVFARPVHRRQRS